MPPGPVKHPASALALCLLLSGCEGGKSAPPANIPTTEIPPQDTTAPAAPPAAQTPAAPEEPQPADTVTGRLTLTKGAQPMVDGRLVSSDSFEERFGKDWRTLLQGRRVRVKGTLYTHTCAPYEQCLTGGEIPQVRDVRKIDVCISSSLPPLPGERGVPCLPDFTCR